MQQPGQQAPQGTWTVTVGLDVGDRYSHLVRACGHEVIVATARRLQLIAQNDAKSDQVDAELLARLGRVDPALLAPIRHRGAGSQVALAGLRTRDALVRARTLLVHHVRGSTKAVGGRLPKCSTERFARQDAHSRRPLRVRMVGLRATCGARGAPAATSALTAILSHGGMTARTMSSRTSGPVRGRGVGIYFLDIGPEPAPRDTAQRYAIRSGSRTRSATFPSTTLT